MDEEIKGMWQRVEFRGRVLASNVSGLNSQNEEGREKEKEEEEEKEREEKDN